MRGYLGGKRDGILEDADDFDEDKDCESFQEVNEMALSAGPLKYDLVYILDAIYHFPPSVPYFLAQVLPALRPGGTVAYTDILPPPRVSNILGHLILPPLLSVPTRNIMSRPKDLDEYKRLLLRVGYEDVRIEDWSEGVWKGFAENLKGRGGVWSWVGWSVDAADRNEWKYLALRARRPHTET